MWRRFGGGIGVGVSVGPGVGVIVGVGVTDGVGVMVAQLDPWAIRACARVGVGVMAGDDEGGGMRVGGMGVAAADGGMAVAVAAVPRLSVAAADGGTGAVAIAATAVPPIFIAAPAPDGMVVDAMATASCSDDGPLLDGSMRSPSHHAPTATATIAAAAKSQRWPAGLRKTRLQLRQRHL